MDLTATHIAILEVLSCQSEGYLASHDSSAFISIGLEPEIVEPAIKELTENGYVDFYTEHEEVIMLKVVHDSNGNPVFSANGEVEIEWHEEEVPNPDHHQWRETVDGIVQDEIREAYLKSQPEPAETIVTRTPITETVTTLINAGYMINDKGREAFEAV